MRQGRVNVRVVVHEWLVDGLISPVRPGEPPIEGIGQDHDDSVRICETVVFELLTLDEVHEVGSKSDDIQWLRRWRIHLSNQPINSEVGDMRKKDIPALAWSISSTSPCDGRHAYGSGRCTSGLA